MTSAILRPARPQKNQHSGSPVRFPSCMYDFAEGSVSPRSQRETAMADAFNRLPSWPWLRFSVLRNARILDDQSGTIWEDFGVICSPKNLIRTAHSLTSHV